MMNVGQASFCDLRDNMNRRRFTTARLFSTLICFFLTFGTSASVSAQQSVVTAEDQESDVIELRAVEELFNLGRLDRINNEMERAVERGEIVGCSALVFKDSQEAFFNTWGYQDRENEVPITRDTIFRIYSMTKPVTSVAAMQLVEQGLLNLDDPVAQHLPEFAGLRVFDERNPDNPVEPDRAMTVRDLMRHTSGLSYGFFDRTPVDLMYLKKGILVTDRNLASTTEKLSEIPLKHHPGTRFEYSVSTDVLARLIEMVSGQSFDEYLKQQVFDPLEMSDTSFIIPEEKLSRLAVMYREGNDQLVPAPQLASYRFVNQASEFYSGGGGLCSTIDDYLNFSRMLIDEGKFGEVQILQPETIAEMFTNQLESIENRPGSFQFGLGFAINRHRRHGTDYSWGGIAGTRFWANPELKMVSLFMVQVNPNGNRNHGEQVRDLAYRAVRK